MEEQDCMEYFYAAAEAAVTHTHIWDAQLSFPGTSGVAVNVGRLRVKASRTG
jgi:hypothetical protein